MFDRSEALADFSRHLQKALKKKGLEKIEWGKWGIISEPGPSLPSASPGVRVDADPFRAADIYTKDTEFRAWLIGERMINPETLSKAKEKDIFKVRRAL